MQLIDPASILGSAIFAFVAFLITTALLHVFFVWLWPQSSRFWKGIDYLWLALALLAVVGVAGEVRRFAAENQIYQAREATAEALRRLAYRTSGDSWECNRSLTGSRLEMRWMTPGWKDEHDSQVDAVCGWMNDVKNILHAYVDTGRFPILELPTFPQVSPREPGAYTESALLADVRGYVGRYTENQRHWLLLQEQAKRSRPEILLLAFGPVLAASGLALRFTKVTAELQMMNRSTPSVTQSPGSNHDFSNASELGGRSDPRLVQLEIPARDES
jgi:hypothetical protein